MNMDDSHQQILSTLDKLDVKIDGLCDRMARMEQKNADGIEELKKCQERKDRNYKIGFSLVAIIFSLFTLIREFI